MTQSRLSLQTLSRVRGVGNVHLGLRATSQSTTTLTKNFRPTTY